MENNDPRLMDINETNCFNSTDIGFADIYTITTKASGQDGNVTSGAESTLFFRRFQSGPGSSWMYATWLPVFLGALWVLL